MPAGTQPLVPLVRRGIRLQLIAMALSLAVALLIAEPARASRLQATILLLFGIGIVLDGRSLRANGALLTAAQQPHPHWLRLVSGLALTLGTAIVLGALVFLWHPRAAP